MMEFVFEESPWEQTLKTLPGDLSAARALVLLEEMSDEEAEEALLMLETQKITLDISDLPPDAGSGETALRLRQEQQWVKNGRQLEKLDENDPLGLYLKELSGLPVAGDAQRLAEEYAAGKEAVLQNLTDLCLSRVVEEACALTGRGVLLLDLIQEGSLGLWQGILAFTGGEFYGHIDWWIRQYLAKAVLMQARSSGIGQKMRNALEDFRDMDQQLLSELGRNPTIEEIAEAIHITPEEAATVAEMLTQAKLRQRSDAPAEPSPDDDQAVENTALFQARQRVLDMLSSLPEQEAKLLSLRFGLEGGLPKTAQQAGEILGLTAEEAVKMEAAALEKLRRN